MASTTRGRTTEWILRRRKDSPVYSAERTYGGERERVTTGQRTRANAQALIRRWNRTAADPTHAAAEAATLKDAMTRGLLLVRRERSSATFKSYREKSGHLLRILGEGTPLASLSTSTLQDYIDERRTTRICPQHLGGAPGRIGVPCTCQLGVADATIKKELTVLRRALKAAREARWINSEQERVVPSLRVEYLPRERCLSRDEAEGLCAHVAYRFGAGRGAHIRFILGTGARLSESLAACREDFDGQNIHLRGTKTTGANRVVPVTSIALPWLQRALASAPNQGLGRLFHRWTNIQRDLKLVCQDLGIPPVSPNDLRRTYASWHIQAGLSTEEVAKLLGHSGPQMVQRVYGRDSVEHQRARIQKLGLIPVGTTASHSCGSTTALDECLNAPETAGACT